MWPEDNIVTHEIIRLPLPRDHIVAKRSRDNIETKR